MAGYKVAADKTRKEYSRIATQQGLKPEDIIVLSDPVETGRGPTKSAAEYAVQGQTTKDTLSKADTVMMKAPNGEEKEADVAAYAKSHNISYDQAKQIKTSRGGK